MDRIKAAQVFVSIAERGSLAAAADLLNMSRPMVTRYLNEMEDWAHSRLLNRSTRCISLTPAGENILDQCKRMLQLSTSIEQVADTTFSQPRGIVRVACIQSLAKQMLAPAIAKYLSLYPDVSVELIVGSNPVNMIEDRIDLAVRVTNDLEPNLIARRLGIKKLRLVASPDFVKQYGQPSCLEDLKNFNCLTHSLFNKSNWLFHKNGDRTAIQVRGNLSSNDTMSIVSAVLNGCGIALLPDNVVSRLLTDGYLCEILPESQPVDLGIHGVYISREHMSATLRTLLDFLVEWFETYWDDQQNAGENRNGFWEPTPTLMTSPSNQSLSVASTGRTQ